MIIQQSAYCVILIAAKQTISEMATLEISHFRLAVKIYKTGTSEKLTTVLWAPNSIVAHFNL